MQYETKNFDHLLGLNGFSDELLKAHFGLYQGYVKNTNKAHETLQNTDLDAYLYGEVARRFGWEFNGMRLHELYFENMKQGSGNLDTASALAKSLNEHYSDWEADFRAKAGMRGIGWVVLYKDMVSGRLFNTWINEHDMGHLTGCEPLLILDAFEHAYIKDYGMKKADYINAFMKVIDWEVVSNRFEA